MNKVYHWGNSEYINLKVGESYIYNGHKVSLHSIAANTAIIDIDGLSNKFEIIRKGLPQIINGIRVFLADNRFLAESIPKRKANFSNIHSATSEDALICLSDASKPLLDPDKYSFPIGKKDGYQWNLEEASAMFWTVSPHRTHEGIDINLHEARGGDIHPILAVEDSTIVWIHSKGYPEAGLLLKSNSQKGIYYVYQHLNINKLFVAEGDRVQKGQILGYIWGDDVWGHLHFAVIHREAAAPDFKNRYDCLLNQFPQLYELWFGDTLPRLKEWKKGCFQFARPKQITHRKMFCEEYNELTGYGWLLGDWCPAGAVEKAQKNYQGDHCNNARLLKTLWKESGFESVNPENYYDFVVTVENGVYDVRALVGDKFLGSWQHVLFNEYDAGEFNLPGGQYAWVEGHSVRVSDGRLQIRFFLNDVVPAGISQLDFVKVGD